MIFKYLVLSVSLLFFSGCARYYSTAPETQQNMSINNRIPVKVQLAKIGSSIVVDLPEHVLKKNVDDILYDSPVFFENNTSKNVLEIVIKHHNDHGGAEIANAVLTGASLYLIPGVADSDVDINISMNGISSNYQGELVLSQGIGADAMIDKTKYKEDNVLNVTKNLIKNAMDKFTTVYLSLRGKR